MNGYILAALDDMFFAAKIRATAEQVGSEGRFVKTVESAMEKAREEAPALVIADLHSTRCDPFDLAQQIKADDNLRRLPLIGFFSHVHTELRRRAEQSGFDRVMPRSFFSKNLPEILAGNITG